MKVLLTYLAISPVTNTVFASHGQTFKIEEASMQEALEKFSSTSEKKRLKMEQRHLDDRIKKIQTPTPVSGIEEAKEYHSFYYDPIYVVEEEIADLKGNIIASKGQIVSPMKDVHNLQDLLFFDGTNPKHIQWVQSHPQAKWILVKGSPFEVAEETEHDVFFDQMGALCSKFGIARAPAKVSQQGQRILIEEIPCQD